jgi:hypothetical protein
MPDYELQEASMRTMNGVSGRFVATLGAIAAAAAVAIGARFRTSEHTARPLHTMERTPPAAAGAQRGDAG